MTSDQVQPEISWLIGDYITGSSYEEIAKRYGIDVEIVQAHVDYGMVVRAEKLANTKPYKQPVPVRKKSTKAAPINVPVSPTITFQGHQIRVLGDMYCLSDLMEACGLCRQNIQSLVKHIDISERQKLQTRWQGGGAARAWFMTLEGIKQWSSRTHTRTKQKSRQTLSAFIEHCAHEYTPWMPIEELAALVGKDEYDLLWIIGEPKGDAMGLECSKKNGRGAYLYRAFKP